MPQKSQKERVIDKLNQDGSVDNFWAINNYVLRLAAVIASLRKDGWEFRGEWGEGHHRKNWYYRVTRKPSDKPLTQGKLIL